MCVSVDGGEVVEYDCSSDTTDVEFKIPLLVSNGFATSTEHTVTITPKSDNGNLWIDVDAFIVVNGATTYTYTYGDSEWKDLLTNYNGEAITYDAIGNPLNYRNGMVFSWVNGRSLATLNASELSAIFEYNASGIRTKKTVNGVTTEYILDEQGTLIGEICGEDRIIYYYDEQGSPIGFCLNGTADYYFGTNLVGDITAIYDANGTFVAGYSYNEFGILLEITGNETVANLNHLRFKGYYYDTETGLYYLQSRYYDPVIGRFINADDTSFLGASGTTLGYNLFTYCDNDAVNNEDPFGYQTYITARSVHIFPSHYKLITNSKVLKKSSNKKKYLFDKKLLAFQTITKYITLYEFQQIRYNRGKSYIYGTGYLIMTMTVARWKSLVKEQDFSFILDGIGVALDVLAEYSSGTKLGALFEAMSKTHLIIETKYGYKFKNVVTTDFEKYILSNIKGKKDKQCVNILFGVVSWQHNKTVFSRKYKTQYLYYSYGWSSKVYTAW